MTTLTPKQQFLADRLQKGEKYAGIILGANGESDHHVFLLPSRATSIGWKDAVDWARKSGGELPTRREQALLFANLKNEFEPGAHWSAEEYGPNTNCAWYQVFSNGGQFSYHMSIELRARAVRRLVIE